VLSLFFSQFRSSKQLHSRSSNNSKQALQSKATMGKTKQQTKSVDTKAPKTNEKGEIISWDSANDDGAALKTLFDGGLITTETAKVVKKEHPRFRKCAVRTLNSALANERKRLEAEVDNQVKKGSSGEFGGSLLVSRQRGRRRVTMLLPTLQFLRFSPQS